MMTTTSTENLGALDRITRQLFANDMVRWWIGELRAIVPESLRVGHASLAGVARVNVDAVDAFVAGTPPVQAVPVVLEVPATKALRRTLWLPLATEENLSQVLEFQMDQYTPFSAAQVYSTHSIRSSDSARGQLELELIVVARDVVDQGLQRLQSAGYQPVAVQVLDDAGVPRTGNLLPEQFAVRQSVWRKGPVSWLLGLTLMLAMCALVLPLYIKREAAIQMLPLVERVKKSAENVDGVRRELDARIVRYNYLLDKRAAVPTVIQALEHLTHVLPDDTWVQTLDWKGKELVIQGETASSVKLVGLFEQSSLFKDASFRSPLTKGQTAGTERFSLALQVRMAPASATGTVASGQKGAKP